MFENLFDILTNNTLSRAELSSDGKINNIHYGDILTRYGNILDLSQEYVPYININSTVKHNESYLKDGDIIIADTAEDITVGKTTEIYNLKHNLALAGLHTIPCRPKMKFESKYLGYYMNGPQYHKQLFPLMQGIKVLSISKANISKTIIRYPSMHVQKKQTQILSLLDKKITKQKEFINHLKSYKRGLLSRLFPKKREIVPVLRFRNFTNDWEQRKLSDIVNKAVDNRGKTPPLNPEGTHPLIEVAALGNGAPDYSKVEKYLDDNSFENNLRAHLQEDDILFSTVGSIGLVSLMDSRNEACIAQNIVAFRAKQEYDAKYLYAMFSNEGNQKKAQRIVMGAVQPSIKVSQLAEVEYMVSQNANEQVLIGELFMNLDHLINLHQQKLDMCTTFKKYLLQKMFV